MLRKTTIFALIAVLSLVTANAQAGGKNDPVGTWLVTVTIPEGGGDVPPPPTFQQMITFQKHGTLTETNNTLHANSANPGETLNFKGSLGLGVWDKGSKKMINYRILKMVFDGISDDFLGYLVMDGQVKIDGGVYTQSAEDSHVALIFGTDPDDPAAPSISYGGADAVGHRVELD